MGHVSKVVDLENFLNSIKPALDPATTRDSAAGGEAIKDVDNQFSAIFKRTVAAIEPEQSGKILPASGNPSPARQSLIGANYELESRQLQSGLTILVAGPEPSSQDLAKFAADQGIDLSALYSQHPENMASAGSHEVSDRPLAASTSKPTTYSGNNSEGQKTGPQETLLAGEVNLETAPMSPLPTRAGNSTTSIPLPLQSSQAKLDLANPKTAGLDDRRIARNTQSEGSQQLQATQPTSQGSDSERQAAHSGRGGPIPELQGTQTAWQIRNQMMTEQFANSTSTPQPAEPTTATQAGAGTALQPLEATNNNQANALVDRRQQTAKGAVPSLSVQAQRTELPRAANTNSSNSLKEPNGAGASTRTAAVSATSSSPATAEQSAAQVSSVVPRDTSSSVDKRDLTASRPLAGQSSPAITEHRFSVLDSRTLPKGEANSSQAKMPSKQLTSEIASAHRGNNNRPTPSHSGTPAGQSPQPLQFTRVSQASSVAAATSAGATQSTNAGLTDQLLKQQPAARLGIEALRIATVKSNHSAIPRTGAPLMVEPINLQPTPLSGASSVSEAPPLSLQSSIADGGERLSAQVLREAPVTDSSVVRDQYSQMSKTLSDALGQRIVAQLARGEWRVEMQLHPTNLGQIEIHLEMKNGELEANFYTANQVTKELINEGLPRLRQALEQQAMESAQKGLDQGNQDKSKGNSSGQNNSREQYVQMPAAESSTGRTTNGATDDGLDILI